MRIVGAVLERRGDGPPFAASHPLIRIEAAGIGHSDLSAVDGNASPIGLGEVESARDRLASGSALRHVIVFDTGHVTEPEEGPAS